MNQRSQGRGIAWRLFFVIGFAWYFRLMLAFAFAVVAVIWSWP